MGRLARQFGEIYRQISADIFKFCEVLRFKPSWQQELLFTDVMKAHYGLGSNWIACKSGQGPGKTTAAAIVGLWRSLQAVNALTVVTAPTMRQCRDVWLVEARRRVEQADDWLQKFIKITKSKVEIGGMPDWGVKLVTATREENAQGYHEQNMTVICEEASGIPREIVTQFKGTLSNPNALFLMIGNPNTRDCAFFDCFNSQRHRWKCLTFNAEETARDYPYIVNPQRNQDLEEEFGRESDVYRIRVLGEFPHSDPNCVMSSEDVEKCMDPALLLPAARTPRDEKHGGGFAKQFGIDVARFGGDESTIFRRSGNAVVDWTFFVHTEPSEVIDHAFRMQKEAEWRNDRCWYVADAGGMGQGVMHKFYDADKQIVEFHNGGKSIDRDYANKITEGWFHLSRLVKKQNCYLPKDNQLLQQLAGRQYFTDRKGKLVLETKDEYIKRSASDEWRSPDRADGCVMAFYDEVEAVAQTTQQDAASREVGQRMRR